MTGGAVSGPVVACAAIVPRATIVARAAIPRAAIVARARATQATWSKIPIADRAARLKLLRERILSSRDALARREATL